MSQGLTTERKSSLIAEYKIHEKDTGSADVQIAILTERIRDLTAHVQIHKKDHHTRLGLTKLVAQRRRLLNYLRREDFERFRSVRDRLQIRA